ncbi:BamA/TamA family outer membrane protein [Candidatus Babeliales bacterium]|nr:BamA/TamA family outer membrane protein [Candidatus Babeliales bacterium]
MRLYMLYFLIFLFTGVSVSAQMAESFSFDMPKEALREKISPFVGQGVIVDYLSYTPERIFSEGEFEYLTGFVPHEMVTVDSFLKAFSVLRKKDIFKSMLCTFSKEDNKVILHCDFEMDWVVKWVKLRGIGLGKEPYLQAYGLYAGDHFDYQKHTDALVGLKEHFKKEGYFDIHVDDILEENNDTHQVTIYLQCKRGIRFSIADVTCVFNEQEAVCSKAVKDYIKKLFQKKLVHKKYSETHLTQVTKEIKKYLENEGYSKAGVHLQTNTVSGKKEVYLTITIKPTIKRKFVFLGNAFFNENELLDFLYRFGDSVSMISASLFAEDIETHYYKKGFWRVHVEGYEEGDTAYFVINEGPRICINDVHIISQQMVVSSKKSKMFFSSLLKKQYFDADILKVGIGKLLEWYRSCGYLDVTIIKRTYREIQKNTRYILELVIDEGRRSLVRSEIINDHNYLLDQGPFATTKNGDPYTIYFLKERKEWLQNYFRKKGYMWVDVSYHIKKEVDGDTVVWDIKKGDPVVFGKTIVRGIMPIANPPFLRHLDYKEGDMWSKQALQETQKQFKLLDIFKQSSFYPDPEYSKKMGRDILVNLQEDDFFEIRTRIGFAQVSKNLTLKKGSTYKVGGTLFFRNVTGNADIIRSDVDITRFERRLAALYETPHFLQTPCALTAKIYSHNYTQPLNAGSRKTLYKSEQEGFLATLASHKRTYTAALTCGFEWAKTTDISYDLAQAINFSATLVDKKIPFFVVEPNIFVDLLDNKLEPTKGYFLLALIKGVIPFKSESSYMAKFIFEQGMFFPLIKNTNIIVGLRFKCGHIFKELFSSIMPPDRFYLGGAHSLRGYLPDRCPPLGMYTDDVGQLHYVPQGGKSMMNMNVEIRIPVIKNIHMAVFQDAGILVEDIHVFNESKKQLAATGFGLRYMTPFGPLRFDIGWKWKKDYPEDSGYAWFLTFGHAF